MGSDNIKILNTMESSSRLLTLEELLGIMPSLDAEKAATLLPHINEAMQLGAVNTPKRMQAFLA